VQKALPIAFMTSTDPLSLIILRASIPWTFNHAKAELKKPIVKGFYTSASTST